MLLQNKARRLIQINMPQQLIKDEKGKIVNAEAGEKYQLLPAGPAVNVPDTIMDAPVVKRFVEQLIKDGDIVCLDPNMVAPTPNNSGSEFDSMTDDELQERALIEGIEITEEDDRDSIIEKLSAK